MLTSAEQDYLYEVIEAVLGADPSIKNARRTFTEQTVDVVEEMIEANARCNSNMKELIMDLLAGGRLITKGWLRKALSASKKQLRKSGNLNGYGCRVATKGHWRSAIIISAN